MRALTLVAALAVALPALGCAVEATEVPDDGDDDTDSEFPGGDGADAGTSPGDAGTAECAEGVPGCTCTEVPGGGGAGASCIHTFGGNYVDTACSASYQCCNGEWLEGTGVCGECACTEPTGEVGCAPEPTLECFPSFQGASEPIPDDVRASMTGSSWHEDLDCPPFESLRLLTLDHWGFDGLVHRGQLVVAADVADDMLAAFRTLYEARFPIERMELVDAYGGDDDASMAANNTSAFNCRAVTGGTGLSEHSFGKAIDINPVQNPYVRNETVLPPAGSAYLDRGRQRAGMIVAGSPAIDAFVSIGWTWGGEWTSLKDYQHFSLSGR